MNDDVLKKVLFFGANSSYSHSMLSYAYIRSFSDKFLSRWQWSYLETVIAANPMEVAVEINDRLPDAIIATAYLFNIEFLLKTLSRVKSLSPQTPVILGGPEFIGDNSVFLQRHPYVDAVIRGDESSVYLLLKNLLKQEYTHAKYLANITNSIEKFEKEWHFNGLNTIPCNISISGKSSQMF